jgi:hypothetical protein
MESGKKIYQFKELAKNTEQRTSNKKTCDKWEFSRPTRDFIKNKLKK